MIAANMSSRVGMLLCMGTLLTGAAAPAAAQSV